MCGISYFIECYFIDSLPSQVGWAYVFMPTVSDEYGKRLKNDFKDAFHSRNERRLSAGNNHYGLI